MNIYSAQQHIQKFFAVSAVFLLLVLSLPLALVYAEPNYEMNYQGKLTNASNVAVTDGTYQIVFSLYTASSSGSAIWSETRFVETKGGLFSEMLGSETPLTGVDFNQALYLGIAIETDDEMTPRKILGTVPAAFEARNASTVGGVASTSLLRNDRVGSIATSSASTLLTITQSGAGDILNLFDGGTEVFTVLDGGNVGIGSSTPSSRLTVAGNTFIGGSLTATGTLLVSGTTTLATTTISSSTITTLTLNNALALTSGGTGATSASGARTNLGATTVGANIFTLTNPGAVSFLRINADNTVSAVATSTLGIALSDTTGTLAVNRGGTGAITHTSGSLLVGNGTSAITSTTTAGLKSTLGLNNVENTALSTWAGSSNITTLGTIGTGVWQGTAITDTYVENAITIAGGTLGSNSISNGATWSTLGAFTIGDGGDRIDISSDSWDITNGVITNATWNGTDIDVSDYTNLGVTATGLSLSGDNIALTAGYTIPLTASTTAWNNAASSSHVAVTLAGEDYLSLSTQQITANAIDADNLSASDFGSFSCNGTTCTLDSGSVDVSTHTNLSVSAIGLALSGDDVVLSAGYSIPLTASTTNWNTFYNTPSNRITAGNHIDWTGNTLDVVTTGDWTGTFDGQEGTYYLNAGNLTGTLASGRLTGAYTGVTGLGTLTSLAVTGTSTMATTTLSSTTVTRLTLGADSITDFTGSGLIISGGALTVSTSSLANLDATTFNGELPSYYLSRTNHTGTQTASTISDFSTTARSLLSSTATGLTYTSGTGVFSLTAGYNIPLTASTTDWNTAYSWGDHALAGYITSADDTVSESELDDAFAGLGTGLVHFDDSTDTVSIDALIDDSLIDNAITVTGGTIGSNSISSGTTWSTLGTLTIGDGGDRIDVSSNSWDVTNGVITNATWNGADVDVSDYTNLGVTATGLTLSGDNVALTAGYNIPLTASTTDWNNAFSSSHVAVTLAGEDYLSLATQQITANAIDPDNLSASDFGSFSCNGTTCTLDSSAVDISTHTNLSVSATGLALTGDDVVLSAGYNIPLTASTSAWNTFYTTPSNRITAGNHIDWTGNTLDVVTTGDWTGTFDGNNLTGGAVATGDLLYGSGAGTIAERAIGTTGQVLTVSGGLPVWSSTSTLGLSAAFSDSAGLAALLSDETGTGFAVFSASPTFTGTANFADIIATNATTTNATTTQLAISSLTSGRVPYVTTGGRLIDNANLTFNGTSLTFGTDAALSRGAANRLDLASGDSFNVVSGSYQVGATTVIDSSRRFQAASGTLGAGTLAYSFSSDTNTGIYSSGADILRFVTGGSTALEIDASGKVNTRSIPGLFRFGGTPYVFADDLPFTGSGNSLLGSGALAISYNDPLRATYNVAVGSSALGSLESGHNNVVVGSGAMVYSATSSFNTIVGADALISIASSTMNTVLGYGAGYLAQTGANNNLLLGYQAANNLTTGNNNIIIGYDVDSPTATADNVLNIGNLIFGTGIDGTGTTLSSGNIGIGTSSPTSKLSVAGDLRVTGGSDFGIYNTASISTPFSEYKGINNELTIVSGEVYPTAFRNYINSQTTDPSAYITGIHNLIEARDGGYTGIMNQILDVEGYATGIDNTLTASTSMTDPLYGIASSLTLNGAGQTGYNISLFDGNSTGGTQYGLHINIQDPDTTNYSIYVEPTSGASYFGSNVGLGTSTPTQLLHVQGNARLSGALYDSTNSTGTSGMVLQATGTSTRWVATSSLGFSAGVSFSDSAGLAALLSDETGTGFAVFSASPTFTGTAFFANSSTTNATTTNLAISSLTSGRIPFATTGGRLIDDANFTFNGTNLVLGGTDGVQMGGDVLLNRGAANRLDLATGDSMRIVSGSLEFNTDVSLTRGAANRLDLASGDSLNLVLGAIAFNGTNMITGSTTNGSYTFGVNAGATFNSATNNNIAIGDQAGRYASTSNADNSIYIGASAGISNTGGNNILFGSAAGSANVGSSNTFIGNSAGAGNTGSDNLFLGNSAGAGNTGSANNIIGGFSGAINTGSSNNIFGSATGVLNTGSFNNMFGNSAGMNNTGSYSDFIGFETAGRMSASTTVAIGGLALRGGAGDVSSGNAATTTNNTVIGYGAGYNVLTGGNNNILLGYQAADNLTTGANNIVIGYDVDVASTTGSNRLNIGNLIFGTGIDGTGTTLSSGNIGIGTSTPTAKLSVVGSTHILGETRLVSATTSDLENINHLEYAPDDSYTGNIFNKNLLSLTFDAEQANFATAGGIRGINNYMVLGSDTGTTNGLYGESHYIGLEGPTVSQVYGSSIQIDSWNPTDTTAYGQHIYIGGPVTNRYGVYIVNDVYGAGNELDYGIYQESANADNYFAGNVGIGSTSPSSKLTVSGDTYIGGNLTATGTLTILGATSLANLVATNATTTNATTTNLAISSLTSGRIPFATTGGRLIDDANFTFNGTNLVLGGTDGVQMGGDVTINRGAANRLDLATGDSMRIVSGSLEFNTDVSLTRGAANRLDLASGDSLNLVLGGIAFNGTTTITASTTNRSYTFGELAGATFTNNTLDNIAIGYGAGQFASTTSSNNIYMGPFAGRSSSGAYNNNFFGEFAGASNTGTDNNMFGGGAGINNTGSNNNMLGNSVGINNTGSNNSMFGTSAGSINAGSNNNMFGTSAGSNNAGSNNNMFGTSAGASNTGSDNNMFGQYAGWLNTGSFNEFFGSDAGRFIRSTSSIAIGSGALRGTGLYTALNNVALGYRAGYVSGTGANNNILLGYQAADNLTTGNNNIIIGFDVDSPTATADNVLNIGNLLFGTGIDGTGTTLSSGKIGIGSSTPVAKLSVEGNAVFQKSFAPTGSIFPGTSTLSVVSNVTRTATGTMGNVDGLKSALNISGSGSMLSSVLSAQESTVWSSWTGTNGGTLIGNSASAGHDGSGTVSKIIGQFTNAEVFDGQVSGALKGQEVYTYMDSATTSSMYGQDIYVEMSGGGVTGDVYGASITVDNFGGTTIGGDQYGLYMYTNGTPLGSAYGIYQDGGDNNYFSGNVGIGSTSPSSKLTVVGNTYIGGNLTATGTLTILGATNLANLVATNATTTNATTTNLAISSLTSGRIPFATTGGRLIDDANFTFNGTNLVLGGTDGVQMGGDVTINRGAANRLDLATGDSLNLVSGALQVAATTVVDSSRRIFTANGSVGAGLLAYSFSADTNTGIYGTGSDVLGFVTGGTEQMTILANGNVGIGTTTPLHTLSIAVNNTNTATSALNITQAGTGDSWMNFSLANGRSYAMGIDNSDNDTFKIDTSTTGPLGLGGALNLFAINTSGFVGIGTTTPNLSLEVVHSSAPGIVTAVSRFSHENSNAGLTIMAPSLTSGQWAGLQMYNTNQDFSIANQAGTRNFTITNGGNVGIGTTTPGYKFDVHSGVGDRNIYLDTPSSGPILGTDYGSGASIELYNQTTGNMTLSTLSPAADIVLLPGAATGNVGIGTTTPGSLLTVAGDSSFSGQLNMVGASANIALGSNYLSGDGDDEGVFVKSDGTVGINMANHWGLLQVGGNFAPAGPARIMQISTVMTSATTDQFGFANTPVFHPTAALNTMYGTLSLPTIATSSQNITNVYGVFSRIDTAATYTGRITNGYGVFSSGPSQLGSQPYTNYYGLFSSSIANGNGTTTGTINNVSIQASNITAAAGAGGTINNYGVSIVQPQGNTAGTSNYGLYINGNGGASATNNFSFYNNSTADSYFAGSVGIGTTSPNSKFTVVGFVESTNGYKQNGETILHASSTKSGIFVGHGAGENMLTGVQNTSLGFESLNAATSSSQNTAVGRRSLYANTSGGSNTAVGRDALYANLSGGFNAAFGESSLANNTTGFRNSAFGRSSMFQNTTGTYNVAVGESALGSNTTGSYNTAIGFNAGAYLADGSTIASSTANSLFLGVDTKAFSNSDTNSIVIGYDANGVGSNSVVLGNDSIARTVLKGSVGIGTSSPAAKLTVNGAGTTNANYTNGDSLAAALVLSDTGSTAGSGGQILFSASQGIFAGVKGVLQNGTGPAGALVFQTRNTSGNVLERMRVNFNGNVGIGTSTPEANLTVVGSGAGTSPSFIVASSTASQLLTVLGNGLVGIGTSTPSHKLTVYDSQATNYVARITNANTANTADGLLISLGVANASRTTGNYFVGFSTLDGTVAGKIQGGASAVAYTTTAADLAEYFNVAPSREMPEAGEIVALDDNNEGGVMLADDETVPFGIVATNPGFIGNGPICKATDVYCDENYAEENAIVSLIGQVPVKVNGENGPIAVGDSITISSTEGEGMKANFGDRAVGYALTSFDGDDESDSATITAYVSIHRVFDISLDDMVAGVASSSTMTTESFFERIRTLASGFVDGVLTLVGIKAEEVQTERLCIGETCVTESQLIELLQNNGQQPASNEEEVEEGGEEEPVVEEEEGGENGTTEEGDTGEGGGEEVPAEEGGEEEPVVEEEEGGEEAEEQAADGGTEAGGEGGGI